ncbi:MAG: SpoIVB peptidase [Firmicutes bacterium]|nr:SpoIVB peptidase [Bacillota bacterium]
MNRKIKSALIIFVFTLSIIGIAGFAAEYTDEAKEAVQVISERVLVPGGQSVGIRMNVKGVLVVGLEEIETEDSVVSPGYSAGLQIGDMILSINDEPVYYAKDVSEIVNKAELSPSSNPLKLKVLRKEKELEVFIEPVLDRETGEKKIGVWVKEKIAGIGTLTFYDPQTNLFAALGHGIYENQTGTLLEAGNGQLLRTEVKSIQEGEAGKPGEIRGIFYGNEDPIGDVVCNSQFGIYSQADDFRDFQLAQPMVMGRQDQVEVGDAYILTTIDGSNVEKFDIKITKVNPQKEPESKGMEIEVVDEKLLASSGGIVQGMSGSPIIQNNRIIGAVTHVLVNNPTKGYGIFVEWMIEECEKNI